VTSFADHWRGRARSLATFGDSITAGSAASATDRRWANLLAADLYADLRNKGVSGTVMQRSIMHTGEPRPGNGRDRYEADLLGDDRADVVAILYGFNDARYVLSPSTFGHENFVRDYREVLAGLFNAGYAPAAICLGSPPHIPDAGFSVGSEGFSGQSRVEFQRYVRTVESIAHDAGTYYAPVNELMGAQGGDTLLSPDLVHPNDAGHARIAAAFAGAILSTDRFLK
jgi:lysophospholipase L1-like esterase